MATADAPPDLSTEARSEHDSNNVNLRVTYLHAGNPRPPHDLGQMPADTTIEVLKSRLQSELLESPRPEEQRLIYQGRPLLQDAMTLREALRLSGPIGPLPYTIHIIIQPRHAASHFRPDPAANVPAAPLVNGGQPGAGAITADPLGQTRLEQDQLNAQVERMHAVAQAHLNVLQQQLHTLQQQHGLHPNQRFSATVQINGQHVHPLQYAQPGPTPTTNNPADQQQPQLPPRAAHDIPPQLQHGLPGPVFLNAGQQMPNPPFQRPLSVPPPARPDAAPLPFHIHQHPPMIPPLPRFAVQNAHVGTAPRLAPSQPPPTTVWLASSRNGPSALLFAPGHGYFSSGGAAASLTGRANPLLAQMQVEQNGARAALVPGAVQSNRPARRPAQPVPHNQQQQPIGPVAGPLALQQALRAGQAPGAQARPRALNDDFMGLVIQRGWLFLRLYMFMFVLSEPGTWRRYLLLGLALIVCLLPRQNPLSNLMVAARRHIDNLIGPPAPQRPPAAAAGAAQQAGQPAATPAVGVAGAPRPAAVRGAVNITPEQAATRILGDRAEQERREREAGNDNNNNPPNVLRDTFYRVEQAVALFLASLIPGVGERHVAAREEQRRQQLRVEMERVNAERAAAEVEEEQRRRAEAEGQTDGPAGEQQVDKGKAREVVEGSAVATGEAVTEGSSTAVEGSSTSAATTTGTSLVDHDSADRAQQVRERAPAAVSADEHGG